MYQASVQNDVSLVHDKEEKSIDMEALNNGVVKTDVIMEVPTLVEIVAVQPLQVDITEGVACGYCHPPGSHHWWREDN